MRSTQYNFKTRVSCVGLSAAVVQPMLQAIDFRNQQQLQFTWLPPPWLRFVHARIWIIHSNSTIAEKWSFHVSTCVSEYLLLAKEICLSVSQFKPLFQ